MSIGDGAIQVAITSAEGTYRISDLSAGLYALRVSADGFDPSSSSFTLTDDQVVDVALRRWVDGGSAPVPAPLPDRWTLAGRATNADTRIPLAGVQIEVTDGANRGRKTATNVEGRYRLADLAPGSTTLSATLEAYVSKSVTIVLDDDRALDFVLALKAIEGPSGPLVSGRTVDVLSASPLAGVTVRFDDGSEDVTDTTGAFAVTGTAAGSHQHVTVSSASTVERQTQIRVPGEDPTITLISRSFDLRSFDEMFRARGGLHRWVEAPRLVVQRRVLAFSTTTAMTYTATADTMSDAEVNDLVADLEWALPQLTGGTLLNFASVDIELADENAAVAISRPGTIVVARYDGLDKAISAWGYGRWAWNGAGEVQAGALLLDNDFDQSGSPSIRSLRAHELGHTLGYDHVSGYTSVMHISATIEPTPFDLDATTIAFRRRPLNLSPDVDPDPITVNRQTSLRATLTWEGAR